MAQKPSISDDDLEKAIREKIAEGLKNGTLDREIMIEIIQNNVKIVTKKVATPEEYFSNWYNKLKNSYVDINRHGILWQMAQTPRLKLGNVTELNRPATNTGDASLTLIKDINKGMTNLNVKGMVTADDYRAGTTSEGKPYRILGLTLQDETGSLSASIFWTAIRQPIFDARDNKTLIGSTVIMTNAYFDSKTSKYPPSLQLSQSGTVQITDEKMDIREKVTQIKDLTEGSVTVRGRIFYRNMPVLRNTTEGKRKCAFLLVDESGRINCQAWNEKADEIPENGTLIVLHNATYKAEDTYRKGKGLDPRLLNIPNGSNITVSTEDIPNIPKDLQSAADANSEGSTTVHTFAELASQSDIFEGIVYIDKFNSTKYDQTSQSKMPKEIWYLTCNKHEGKYIKWVQEKPDKTLYCPICQSAIGVGDTVRHLRINASITDGTMWYTTSIGDDLAQVIFDQEKDAVMENYEKTQPDKFFALENTRAGGKVYKCKAKLRVTTFGASLDIIELAKISLEEAYQAEMQNVPSP